MIDHVITNSPLPELESIIITSKLSDHFPIVHFHSITKTVNKTTHITSRDFSQLNIDRFCACLADVNWNTVRNEPDTQTAYNDFINTFTSLYDIHFPLTCKNFNHNVHKMEKWMSAGLLISRAEKIRLCYVSLLVPSFENKQKFKHFRNLYNKLIRAAKKLFLEKELIKFQSDLQKHAR